MIKNCSHLKKTALVSALLLEMGAGAQAANIAVDGTTCNLADAITAANMDTPTGGCSAGAGDDVLDLDLGGSPFVLTAQLPDISSNVTINGNGATVSRDAGALEFNVFNINGTNTTSILNDLTITGGNSPVNFGGGLFAGFGTTVEINNCTITDNMGGGVLFNNSSNATLRNSLIDNNTGNMAFLLDGAGVGIAGGNVDIINTTITRNYNPAYISGGGGGIFISDSFGPVTVGITNSTISGNTATARGGGISSEGGGLGIDLNLNNVTVTLNSSAGNGGGIYSSYTDIAVSQSLISGNTAAVSNQWESTGASYVTVNAYNIFGESNAAGLTGVTPGVYDIIPTVGVAEIFDTNLTDNGGATPTHALIANGPALDAIAACLLSTDQTGKSRPIDGDADGNALCDVGAFENIYPDVIFTDGFEN